MKNHKAIIKQTANGGVIAYVVRVDYDGEEQVDNCFGMKHYSSMKTAEKKTAAYIASL